MNRSAVSTGDNREASQMRSNFAQMVILLRGRMRDWVWALSCFGQLESRKASQSAL